MRGVRCQVLLNVLRTSTAKDDNIEQGVRTKAIGTMHRNGCSLASGVETRHDLIVAVLINGEDLTSVARWDTPHCKDMINILQVARLWRKHVLL